MTRALAFIEPPVLAVLANREPSPPDLVGVPDRLQALLRRALAIDPAERPTAGELLACLEAPPSA